jgi:hypothetical protein
VQQVRQLRAWHVLDLNLGEVVGIWVSDDEQDTHQRKQREVGDTIDTYLVRVLRC